MTPDKQKQSPSNNAKANRHRVFPLYAVLLGTQQMQRLKRQLQY